MSNMTQPAAMESQIQSAMPMPVMKYVDQYTDEAVKNGTTPRPPIPVTDSYQMFGQTCHQEDAIIRPLESQGLLRLHPEPYNKREELKKITVSILCNFLDLLDVLVKSGTSPGRDQKIEDLNLLFIHMHHLINEFRPHQARETLKVMMNLQMKNMAEAGEKLCKHMEKAAEILKQCSEDLALLNLPVEHSFPDHIMKIEPMDIDNILASSLAVDPTAPDTAAGGGGERIPEDEDEILCGMVDGMRE